MDPWEQTEQPRSQGVQDLPSGIHKASRSGAAAQYESSELGQQDYKDWHGHRFEDKTPENVKSCIRSLHWSSQRENWTFWRRQTQRNLHRAPHNQTSEQLDPRHPQALQAVEATANLWAKSLSCLDSLRALPQHDPKQELQVSLSVYERLEESLTIILQTSAKCT